MLEQSNFFVYAGPLYMNKCVQYKVSITIYVGTIPHQRKLPKWLLFTNYNRSE